MALPVILVNATGGSDTQASGAGPSTALFGTTDASFSGATVTLTAGTDLTNVATDGSHVLYLLTSTGVRFFKITAKAGSGGATPTVDVTPSPAGTSTSRTWAIGGKLASWTSSSSRLLVDQGGSAGDAKAGWTIRMESGHTESTSTRVDVRVAGDTTNGPFTIEGASGAATRPVVTFNGSGVDLVVRNSYEVFRGFSMAGTGGATTAIQDVATLPSTTRFEGLKISGFSGSPLIAGSGGTGLIGGHVISCELVGGTIGVVAEKCVIVGNKIYDQSSHGIHAPSGNVTCTIANNLIYNVGGDGIKVVQIRSDGFANVFIANNTVEDATGDGIEYTGDNDGLNKLTIINNLLTNNGGYGINFVSLTAEKILARGAFISHNNTYNNTSGASNLTGVLENDAGANPDYVGSGDYTPQEPTLEGTAFPTSIP